MEIVWIALGIIFLLAGLIGCFLPVIPGPPLAFVSLLFLQLTEEAPFSATFLILWAIGIILVTALDYVIPPYATKRFGGSRKGVIGSSVGIFAGIFLFPPWGIIIFPFVGAWVGELMTGKDQKSAFRSAFGAFIGFVSGTMLKLAVTVIMGYYFFTSI